MKRAVSLLLCALFFISCCFVTTSAKEIVDIEYFEDGSYAVVELETYNSNARTGVSGKKTATYYNSNNEKMFAVTLTGYFTYTYGVSSNATSASTSVAIYSDDVTFQGKQAYVQYNVAYGSGAGSLGPVTRTLYVQIACDIYGALT